MYDSINLIILSKMTILNAIDIKCSININCGPTKLKEGGLK